MNIQRPLCSRAADPKALSLRGRERGSVLIVTIWVVMVLAGLALVFSRSMRVEAIATANHVSTLETEETAKGAKAFIKARLNSDDDLDIQLDGETSSSYAAISAGKGYFWLLRPDLGDDDTYAYGIRDEAAKVNLNTAGYEMLMELPRMTSELAACIIDWRDEDSEVNENGGAEDNYYLLRKHPYKCKNDDFETVEEVLLVKGASLEILFGEDTNRNGVLDANEDDGDESPPDDNKNGRLDPGIYDYVTVYSREPVETGSYNITTADGETSLLTLLGTISSLKNKTQEIQRFLNAYSFDSVLDFYAKAQDYKLGLTADEFKNIESQMTSSSNETIDGMINVNTAPKEVLMCIPDITESEAEKLIRARNADDTDTESIAWVYDVLPKKASAIGSYITIHTYQYSADIVAASGDGRAFSRYRMVVDTKDDDFDIVYWKALKHLGWPLDPEILTKLRAGESIEE